MVRIETSEGYKLQPIVSLKHYNCSHYIYMTIRSPIRPPSYQVRASFRVWLSGVRDLSHIHLKCRKFYSYRTREDITTETIVHSIGKYTLRCIMYIRMYT